MDAAVMALKRGFFRLWVLASALWIASFAATLAFRVYAEPACYAVYTVSFIDPIPEKNREIVQDIKQNLVGKPICGDTTPSLLQTFEQLAKEGIATQISYQWQESGGWSADIRSFIGVLDEKEINVAAIQREVRDFVQKDRLLANLWLAYVAVGVPILALLIGIGIFWVFAGFSSKISG